MDPDVRTVHVVRGKQGQYLYEFIFDRPGQLGGGGNSGFQAVNLAVQFGAQRILLVGFDMKAGPRGELHHFGLHPSSLRNPRAELFTKWAKALDDNAAALSTAGVEVINASADTALRGFERMTIQEAFERWRVEEQRLAS